MQFWDEQDKEIIYNFCIQHIYIKHHLVHEVIITTENAHAAISKCKMWLYIIWLYVSKNVEF